MSKKYSLEKSDSRHGHITVIDAENNGKYSKDEADMHAEDVNGYNRQRRMSSYGGGRRTSLGVIEGPPGRRMSLHPTAGMTEAEKAEYVADVTEDGKVKFNKLSWLQLTIVLVVTAVALGTLSMPVVFASLGMVGGVILTIVMGLTAVYTSYVIGQVKIKYPQVYHYPDIGTLLLPGRAGVAFRKFLQVCFVVFLVLIVGSHCLTGQIAFRTISDNDTLCKVVWSVVTMILLFVCALPPSFAEMSFLGYVDFVSIMAAVFVTLVATGIQARKKGWETGWTATAPDISFAYGMLAATNVLFAYSFAVAQFSFMEEMSNPKDFPKSIFTLGVIQITIYTTVGALGYAFVGPDVKSPSLLSAGHTVSRVAFGVALPVIFISGSICAVTAGRFIMDHAFANSTVRYVNTPRGWVTWIGIIGACCITAWIIAQVIPVFSPLLGIISALFNSAFSLYLPGWMWFKLIRQGGCFSSTKNIILTIVNIIVIIFGLVIFGAGTYASVFDMVESYKKTSAGKPFACH
ncbi:hypothetical protein CcaverHIS002_0401730 [Cutaneotrichosporon cavernicola]|uniref:Amino acid transporter transmembrane domain-containing protein n=1 Tax=Cutaneotrichosporon cavernicola TaxID=279322 RepID=A0AA48QVH7_9TREE|nr:uncharacterized protein CcaverHIS019_0401690 [Cutaneotrichosporon cavernicola]BEI83569.1 hypothetical protein CcaverHIS002_0401730 [Cutaneotrichosporon cavernicola]BEI91349.1 hypothetical protein CcaverHIS019_0401690 [Cutaneotrichosporon cavernicola]BEI99122.1 hypothetical protein CcaverHIS631_0401650 [Cutaneotrichosporon cavernicola]